MPDIDRQAYPFTSRWLDVGAGRMHFIDEGPRDAEPIVFVHGTPTWSFEWRHVIAALVTRRRCIAVDHLGFGLSERPAKFSYTPEAHAMNFATFVDALGLDRFTLVVHDFGGPIALPVALDRPNRITRLVLINTWAWSFEGDREMARSGRLASSALGGLLYRHANASLRLLLPKTYGDRRKLTAAIHRQYLDRFPDAWSRGAVLWTLARAINGSSAFYQSLWDRLPLLRNTPALIIWGMKDPTFKPHHLARWRAALPQAQVLTLEAAGHWPHEEQPEVVIDAISAP